MIISGGFFYFIVAVLAITCLRPVGLRDESPDRTSEAKSSLFVLSRSDVSRSGVGSLLTIVNKDIRVRMD